MRTGEGVSGMRSAMRIAMSLVVTVGLAAPARAQTPPPSMAAADRTAEAALETGQRISLDLKGVDILDVLKLLSQKSGLNFVAGRNVSGRVTIFVNDVDVWEAFEIIIGANDLAYERTNGIVTVMTARDYELIYGEKFQERKRTIVEPLKYAKVTQVATVLNQIKTGIGRIVVDETSNTLVLSDVPAKLDEMQALVKTLDKPTETRVYSLNYAEAEKLKEKVQDVLSPVGTFTFDARTNKAIISDLKEVLQKTDQIIRAFDAPDGEVLIEAKIIKAELTDEMDTGIDWQQLFAGLDIGSRGNFRVLSDIVGGTATGAALKLATAPKNNTQVIIEALQKLTTVETLSSPRILVANNQEAKILVGTKEAIVTVTTTVPATGSTVTAPEIQFVDVGTKLFVTPNIKRDGHIQMKVRPEVSTSKVETFQSNRIPIVSTTEAETNVLVKSGTTLVIGGLIETKHDKTKSQIPILGNLPVVGAAFRGITDIKKKTELVVFLTPQIVLPDGSAYIPPPFDRTATPPGMLPQATEEILPSSYRQAVRSRLQNYLTDEFKAAALERGSLLLTFVLGPNGRLVGAQLITSPQGERFIMAGKAALLRAEPFQEFPEGTQTDEVRFRLAVEYLP